MLRRIRWWEQISRRFAFYATILKRSHDGYLLLGDIHTTDGIFFRDHLWVPNTKKFNKLGLDAGDDIFFSAKVNQYMSKPTVEINGFYVYDDIEKWERKLELTNLNSIEKLGF